MDAPAPDADRSRTELTVRGVLLGALITTVFTGANLSMGLRTGVTFSSSIPAAVISMALLRTFGGSILENNMVQTQASAAGTLCNVLLVLPALVMVGFWHGFPFWQTTGVCLVGGALGVLYSVPLRRAMVGDDDLPFPEGIAAAEVLRAGQGGAEGQSGVGNLLQGGVAGGGLALLTGTGVLGGAVSATAAVGGGAALRAGLAFSPALAGVGYLVGIGCCLALLLGLAVSWGVAVPLLGLLGGGHPHETASALADRLWSGQVRLIGAGVIASASVWTVLRLFRPVVAGVRAAFRASADREGGATLPRQERDLPIALVGSGALALAVPLGVLIGACASAGGWSAGTGALVGFAVASAVFTAVFGFLMAAACGYMAGLLGSSSSPVSGIGILGVMAISLPLSRLPVGHAMSAALMGTALFVTAAVVTISSIGNDNLQDLKTGRLVDATPWRQQVALLVGVAIGSAVIAPVMGLLYQAYGFSGSLPRKGMDEAAAMAAPQASLVASIARGIFGHSLPWTTLLIGLALGLAFVVLEERLRARGLRFPALSIGIGIYLPPGVVTAIAIGGVIGFVAERRVGRLGIRPADEAGARVRRRGVLLASGFLVGESVAGLGLAGREVLGGHVAAAGGTAAIGGGFALFAAVLLFFFRAVSRPVEQMAGVTPRRAGAG